MGSASPSYRLFRRVHHVAGAAIVMAWAFTMGSMAWSHHRAASVSPDLTVGQLLDNGAGDTRTFGVYHGDAKIGYAASRRMKTSGGYLFADQAVWDMQLQGTRQRLVANTQALVGDDFGLKSFKTDVNAGVAHMQ